uniref:Uncharacterized protein n=1 Tax=Anopheles albimanus TaxID=7167 RepID=A0A182FCY5_ANOAL
MVLFSLRNLSGTRRRIVGLPMLNPRNQQRKQQSSVVIVIILLIFAGFRLLGLLRLNVLPHQHQQQQQQQQQKQQK